MGTHLISFSSKISKRNQNLFAIIVLLASIFYIFAPFERSKFIYEWIPEKDGNEVRLTLLDKNPHYFELQIPCNLFDLDVPWILEATGGSALQIALEKESVAVTIGSKERNEVDRIILKNQDINCNFIYLTYENDENILKIKSKNSEQQKMISEDLSFEIASYMTWNSQVPNKDVIIKIETEPNLLIKPSSTKTFLIIISFVGILLLLFLFIFMNYKKINFKIYRIEILSIIYLAIIGLTIYPMADDGLYLLEAKVFNQTDILTQYQYPVPFPVGFLHAKINSLFIASNPNLLLMRLIPLLTSLLIWMIFYRTWVIKEERISRKEKTLLWSVWAIFTAAFFVTFRAEPYVALFLLVSLVILKRYQESRPDLVIILTVPLAVLSISFHQSGIIVPFALLSIWIVNTFRINWKTFNYLNLSFSFFVSAYVLFINSDPILLIDKVKDFESVLNWSQPFPGEFAWGYPPWREYIRLKHIMVATPLQIMAITTFFLVLGSLLLITLKKVKRIDLTTFNKQAVLLAILSAPVGLTFAPSKWSGHYSPLVVVALIGLFMILQNHKHKELFSLAFISLGSIVFLRPWVAGGNNNYSFDLNNAFVLNTFNFFVENKINFILFISAATAFLILTIMKKFEKYTYLVSTIMLISVAKQIFPVATDSVIGGEGWTMTRQIAVGSIDRDARCGLFNTYKLEELGVKSDSKFLFSGDYINSPCLQPVGLSEGIWDYPNFSIGGIPIWDQQRLAFKSNIELVYCFDSEDRFLNPDLETCVYSWTSEIPQMRLIKS